MSTRVGQGGSIPTCMTLTDPLRPLSSYSLSYRITHSTVKVEDTIMFTRSRSTRQETTERTMRRPVDVTIRRAFPDDAQALARLAALDGAKLPQTDVLVAEVAGELWAAVAVADDTTVADPFRPTAELVALLRERARQLRAAHAPAMTPIRRLVPLFGGR